ncbi:MAG TPA: leucyl aminopeptidase family protein [Steroidobacteraceae bacterium]
MPSTILLPTPDAPKIVHTGAARARENCDALLVIVPPEAAPGAFSPLPEKQRWQELNARSSPRSGTVRTTTLANQRQTLAVIGYMRAEASNFERLSLAAKMLKEAAARTPETLGLAVQGQSKAATASMEALLTASLAQAFSLPSYRSGKRDEHRIRGITVLEPNDRASGRDSDLDVRFLEAGAEANNLARWLTVLPPNVLDAQGYRRAIADLAGQHGLSFKWLDERALKRLGAGAFLAVSSGNTQRTAGIAHLQYRPGRRSARSSNSPRSRAAGAPDVALVGKGILFDTGGINLKPHRSMLDMHMDMAGSAVALSTLVALARLRAPFAADAWLAITPNEIGPNAFRPQDIVTASNGVTIQVIHTDAEGRMVLADTLALASRTKPRFMIDFATLTGACVYALTDRMSGVFANQESLVPTLLAAGRSSGERVWNFPLDPDYDSDLESKIADVVQCSVDGKGDHILATRFLSRFVPDTIPWAHMDLSSAWRTGGLGAINTDVTGFGVRYTLDLLLRQKMLDQLQKAQP